jgi:hypothetical protein
MKMLCRNLVTASPPQAESNLSGKNNKIASVVRRRRTPRNDKNETFLQSKMETKTALHIKAQGRLSSFFRITMLSGKS